MMHCQGLVIVVKNDCLGSKKIKDHCYEGDMFHGHFTYGEKKDFIQ